jgi:DNA repair protein RecN (Recombination protein N)
LPPEDPATGEEDDDRIEERLARLAKLKRKYGGTIEDVLARREKLAGLLSETENLRIRSEGADEERARAIAAVAQAGLRLRDARRGAMKRFGDAVTGEIQELGMGGAILDVVLEEEFEDGPEGVPVSGRTVAEHPDGIDIGWFRLRPNPGEGAGMLASVASGGELSRVLLALLVVLGEKEEPRTAIFDEVDAGVGGAAAAAVARRLTTLSKRRQVLLVTHLPLIACRAATHLRVEKESAGDRTRARVRVLDREERIGELARMLAGEMDSAIARQHAEALIVSAATGEDNR